MARGVPNLESAKQSIAELDAFNRIPGDVRRSLAKAALQVDGSRIEYHAPNLDIAFAAISPLVAESLLHLEAGNTDKALEKLQRARHVIEVATSLCASIEAEDPETLDDE